MTGSRVLRRGQGRAGLRSVATGVALALAVLTQVLVQTASAPPAAAAGCPDPIRTVLGSTPATAARTVALTFDDGPSPDATAQVLDVLRARGVRATFFVTGANVAAHPGLARRIVAEGHVIGNHTWSHPRMDLLTAADRAAEIDRTTEAIVAATGAQPCFFRGPYGIHRGDALAGPAWERGMTVVDWTLDTRDWETPAGPSAPVQDGIVARATAAGGAHPIVLLHDGGGYRQNTVAALDRIITAYLDLGATFTDPAGRPLGGGGGGGGEGGGAAPSPSPDAGTHVVAAGETLGAIAARYGLGWQDLYAANRDVIGPDPGLLRVGQQLTVPGAGDPAPAEGDPSPEPADAGTGTSAPATTHVVAAGDTLGGVAARHGLGWRDLYAANRDVIGPDPRLLRPGQQLAVPGS